MRRQWARQWHSGTLALAAGTGRRGRTQSGCSLSCRAAGERSKLRTQPSRTENPAAVIALPLAGPPPAARRQHPRARAIHVHPGCWATRASDIAMQPLAGLGLLLGLAAAFRHPAAAVTTAGGMPLRASRGRGLETGCTEPPPPLQGDLSGHRAAARAPAHLKYLGLDGAAGAADTDSWTNLAFWGGTNETELQWQRDHGYSVLLSIFGDVVQNCIWASNSEVTHAVADRPKTKFRRAVSVPSGGATLSAHDGHCIDRMQAWWTGPNSTAGGVWNSSVAQLVKENKLLGVYVGDELLGGGITVSNLTAIFDMVKAVWPTSIVYYNEEWTPLNDVNWTDSAGQPYGKVPDSLDWLSYDFYRLNNVSWLQPMCEYHQNLYPRMNTGKNKNQKAVLLPGGWGSTSGPRGGAQQFKLNCSRCPGPDCDVATSMSCTSDPMSCSNLKGVAPGGDGNGTLNGLAWEVDTVLTALGSDGARPAECWALEDYDNFNVKNAWAYYDWAAADEMIVGIVIWPWSAWMPVASYQGVNVGLQALSNATAAWTAIGKKIRG